jgi:hypothetical protein
MEVQKMEFGKYLAQKGYTWAEDVRTDDFQHIQDSTDLPDYRVEPELGTTELKYNFEVLKRHKVVVPTYLK